MHPYAWANLIRQIPPAFHEILVLVTDTGIELMVQNVLRLENDFIVIRGRTAGSTDGGLIMMVPWDRLSYVTLNRKLREAEVQSIFASFTPLALQAESVPVALPPLSVALPPLTPIIPTPPPPEPATAPPQPAAAAETPPAPVKPPQPSKSVLLARLRARLATEAGKETERK